VSVLAVTLTIDELRALVREESRGGPSSAVVDAPEVMTREQVAKLLQVHPNVVGRYIRSEGLPARKLGNEWRLLRSEVLGWLDRKEGK
jgi:excisionase family DNA binding protein